MDTLLKKFCENLKREGKADSTIKAYQADIKQLQNFSQSKDLKGILSNEIRNFIDHLTEVRGFTAYTINRKINSLKTFYDFIGRDENPVNNIEKLQISEYKPNTLSKTEILALIEVSRKNIRLHTMVELLVRTGIKIGELARLRYRDLAIWDKNSKIVIREYAKQDRREIPIEISMVRLLKSYIKRYNEILVQSKKNRALFQTRTGKSMQIRNIRKLINKAIDEAEIENCCVNDIRNTFIVNKLKSGMEIEKVAKLVGHKSIESTKRYF